MAIPSDGSAVRRGPGRVDTQRLNHRQAGPAELPIRSLIRAEPYEPTTRSIIEQIKQRLLARPPCGVVFAGRDQSMMPIGRARNERTEIEITSVEERDRQIMIAT